MSQLDDFKRVLGLDDDYQEKTSPTNTPVTVEPAVKKKTDPGHKRTVAIPAELHTRINLLGLWMNREGLMDNPRMYEVIAAAIDEYISQHPEAAGYVNKA